jgi:hypothetical protein
MVCELPVMANFYTALTLQSLARCGKFFIRRSSFTAVIALLLQNKESAPNR